MKLYYLILFLCTSNLNGAVFSIDEPGRYFIGSDIFGDPLAVDECLIEIASNDVIINLQSHILTQTPTNGVGGLVGIRIASGSQNIEIKSGFIENITGYGIEIGEGCSGITIDDVQIKGADAGGIYAPGILANPIDKVMIFDSLISSCNGSGGNPAIGIYLEYTTNLVMQNCKILFNDGGSGVSGYGLYMLNCSSASIQDSMFAKNGGLLQGVGCFASECSNCVFNHSSFNENINRSASGSSFAAGINFDTCQTCRVSSCEIRSNVSTNAQVYGFNAGGGVNNAIQDSIVEGNQGATTNNSVGIQDNELRANVINNIIRYNTGTNTRGIFIEDGCDNGVIMSNTIVSNLGSSSSYAIRDTSTPSTSSVVSNYAFNHGTNYSVSYPLGISLPILQGSLSNLLTGLPALTAGLLDNISINP